MAKLMLRILKQTSNIKVGEIANFAPYLDDFTYTVWFSHEEAPATSYAILMVGNSFDLYVDTTVPDSHTLSVRLRGGSCINLDYTVNLNDGRQHLIAVTCDRDSATGLKLYVDNTLVATGDPTPLLASELSGEPEADSNFLNGELNAMVGQARFYNRVLTPEQLSAIWSDGFGAKVSESDVESIVGVNGRASYCEFDAGDDVGSPCRNYIQAESGWYADIVALNGVFDWVFGGIPFSRELTSSSGVGGSIAPDGSTIVVLYGLQEFTAAPAAGYQVNQWLVNGAVVHECGLTHTLRDISDDMTIAVTFSAVTRQLCTIADIKDRLGIGSNTEYDAMLNRIILGLEEIFNNETGRKLLMTDSDVTEYYTGESAFLQLERYPVISITSIKESALYTFGDESALTANTDYRLTKEAKNGIIYRMNCKWSGYEDSIQLVYRGGYCGADETPGTGEHALPADLREAAIMQACFIYKRRSDIGLSSVSAEGGSISKFSAMDLLPLVKVTLTKYRRSRL
ncbi:MAG: hypothetical protein PHQ00_07575 [Phycisphaerae bacterium]|nr:hypothetical protein [Phycisphaerae bacterium]